MSIPTPRSSIDEPDQARGNRSGREAYRKPSLLIVSPSLSSESDEADQARGDRSRRQAHRKSSSTVSFPPPPSDSDETDQARGNRSGTQFRRVRPGRQEDSASRIPPVSSTRKDRTVPVSDPNSASLHGSGHRHIPSATSSSRTASKNELPLGITPSIEFSTNGHTTYEIPLRPKKVEPRDEKREGEAEEKVGRTAQEGLKLILELNLDMDIELKASIHGDIVLAVL